jgi:predicted ATP-grasp superfamily ATP-dependent carboligase
MLDSTRRVATASRYVRAVVIPDEHAEAAADAQQRWLDVLMQIGSLLPRPGVLVPTADTHVELVAEHQQALSRWFRFLVPAADQVAAIHDKAAQYQRAAEAGIRTPITHHPRTLGELRDTAATMPFPCILKPFSEAARQTVRGKVLVAADALDLEILYLEHGADPAGFVIQEIIPGDDSELYGYLAFWDADGREHSWLTKRKIRQFPLRFGSGATQETVRAPEVAEQSRRLLEAFSYRGLVGVEWKRDSRDGTWCLMEINARTVTGNQLAITAGVDLPWIAYQEISGTSMPHTSLPASQRRLSGGKPVRWVNEELEVLVLADLRCSGEISITGWLRSMAGARSWALWSWRDPRPFLLRAPALARGLFRALRPSPTPEWSSEGDAVPVRAQPRPGSGSAPPRIGLGTEGIPVGRGRGQVDGSGVRLSVGNDGGRETLLVR